MTQMQEEVDLLNFTALMNLGIALSDLGTFDEASVRLEAALQLLPDSPEALQNVGMNLSRQGRWGEATLTITSNTNTTSTEDVAQF